VILSVRFILFNEVQLLKAFRPIEFRLLLSTTVVRFLQPKNALEDTFSTSLEKVTLVTTLLFWNADGPISVMPLGIVTSGLSP